MRREKERNTVQRSIATATAASLARLVKIETSKGLETAVSLGQQRMHGCSKPIDSKKNCIGKASLKEDIGLAKRNQPQ